VYKRQIMDCGLITWYRMRLYADDRDF